MALAWRPLTAAAAVIAYVLMSRQTVWSFSGFIRTFCGLWLSGLFLWVAWTILLYPKLFSPLRHLPSPSGGSFWNGHFAEIAAKPTGIPMREWINTIPNNGLIRYTGMFNQERIMPTSPKALADVLVTRSYDFEKPSQVRNSIGRILGIGVLLAEGDQHKVQRRNLMPAFAFRHIKDLYPVFWQKSREAIQAMTKDVNDGVNKLAAAQNGVEGVETLIPKGWASFEVSDWASRATLDIIGVAGLGRDFGAIHNPDNELSSRYRVLFRPSKQARILGILGLFIPTWITNRIPVKRNDDIALAARTIRAVCSDLIQEKRGKLARKEPTDVDILSVAIESGSFSDSELIDQLMTFLAAGHETTASAMTWAIYMLCLHPEVQSRLRQEIRENLPSMDSDSSTVSSLDIDHLPYLNAVCNETLRYYAPVPLTVREPMVDTVVMGEHVPKGTRVIICPWAINYSTELWGADAAVFNPERWLAKDEHGNNKNKAASASNYAFLTFLHGPRSCIGQAFSKAEFACLLAAWIGRFEFELAVKREYDEKNMLIKGGITARPAKGLHVHARVVEGW
ncbi:cytochrome P450 [Apiospora phragmitis]|uniref:Cytochrome P450 n=1 Tax=Apiospora phragmitis TaxID=2905665 RepID=A0ABR1TPK4_9PEZI